MHCDGLLPRRLHLPLELPAVLIRSVALARKGAPATHVWEMIVVAPGVILKSLCA